MHYARHAPRPRVVTATIDGKTYLIPEMWLVGFTHGGRRSVAEAVQHWHEQEQMEQACQRQRLAPPRDPAPIRQVCAWCNCLIHDGSLPESHGICDACSREHFGDYAKEAVCAR